MEKGKAEVEKDKRRDEDEEVEELPLVVRPLPMGFTGEPLPPDVMEQALENLRRYVGFADLGRAFPELLYHQLHRAPRDLSFIYAEIAPDSDSFAMPPMFHEVTLGDVLNLLESLLYKAPTQAP